MYVYVYTYNGYVIFSSWTDIEKQSQLMVDGGKEERVLLLFTIAFLENMFLYVNEKFASMAVRNPFQLKDSSVMEAKDTPGNNNKE